jgi:hypothetical protein
MKHLAECGSGIFIFISEEGLLGGVGQVQMVPITQPFLIHLLEAEQYLFHSLEP